MSNVQKAIRDAAEKGGYRYRWWKVNDLEHNEGYNGLQLRALSEHLHDPDCQSNPSEPLIRFSDHRRDHVMINVIRAVDLGDCGSLLDQ